MSAEVETMAYVSNEENGRFVPWHGLGTPVEEAMSSSVAIEKAGLDWIVEPKPIYTGEDKQILIPNQKANVRNTDGKVLGIVTDRYKIVQNKDAFDFTDALIGEGCTYETAGSLMGGKKVFLLAKMPQRLILDDEVDPYICFTNSHDGFGSIRACMTPIRVVCQNTLNLALSTTKRQWSTKHIGDLSSKLEEAKHTLQLANQYMDDLAVVADQMANTTISDDQVRQFLDELFPVNPEDSDRRKKNIEEVKDNFMVCMFAPDIMKFRNTAWGALNAASDFATHVAPKRATPTYQENNFNRVLDGHIVIDGMFEKLLSAMKKSA